MDSAEENGFRDKEIIEHIIFVYKTEFIRWHLKHLLDPIRLCTGPTHNIVTAIRDHVPEWFGADYERRSAMNTKCSPCNVGDCYNNNILERVRPADM